MAEAGPLDRFRSTLPRRATAVLGRLSMTFRPPRLIRVLAPLCALAGVACLYFAFDIGIAEPLNLGGGQFFIPEPATSGRPLPIVHSVNPSLLNAGWMLLGASAVLWLWDVATVS